MKEFLTGFLVLVLVNFCYSVPLNNEVFEQNVRFDDALNSEFLTSDFVIFLQYDTDVDWTRFLKELSQYENSRPQFDKVKAWLITPTKRNSELINNLLSLPRSMENAG
jgi:hypothetical protein